MLRSMNAIVRNSISLCTAALVLAACSENTAPPTSPAPDAASTSSGTGTAMFLEHAHVCPAVLPMQARCHSMVLVDRNGRPASKSTPRGYTPADLQTAYGLVSASSNSGAGQTIAIVDAYDDPNAESDLGVYRKQFNLPVCTTANGCFRKVDQSGATNYPRADGGWAEEISLDLDMASAICPNCRILLVEASSNYLSDLAAGVDRAAALGATVISNSYGGSEYPSETADEAHYDHPGIAITVSSGDEGYGAEFPAASRYVTAVGGTTLTKSRSGSFSETAWSGAGSGCSAYITKPVWQDDEDCAYRTIADVAAVADPNTGVAVYDTFRMGSGWMVFGGTSVASPIIAAVYALAGNADKVDYGSYPYAHVRSLTDITSGSNGRCGGSYLCTAMSGYDGPTGLGTPKGAGGF